MTASSPRHLIIIAGEASGDMHAARLVEELQKKDPQLTFSGLGGSLLRARGVELYEDITPFAVVGFMEVLKHLGDFRRLFRRVIAEVQQRRPAAVILVDYPGFNLRLAQAVKKIGTKVIYYISPQVWAWKENRVRGIKKNVDRMLVLFEFEKAFYARHSYPVDVVGHPLVDTVKVHRHPAQVLQDLGLSPDHLTIGILPGSRSKEISSMLPPMVQAAKIISRDILRVQFLIFQAPTITLEAISRHLTDATFRFKIVTQDYYENLSACDLGMVTSGTATLETALLKKPMVVVYKTSLLTWALAKALIKIPHIGLVNVVAGKRIVPECLQFQANGPAIARELIRMISDEIWLAEIKSGLNKVKQSLGAPGASQCAAAAVLNAIGD